MPRSPLKTPLIITQPFGVDPKTYPYTNGHPGIDLRAAEKTNLYACVPGVYHIINRWPWQYAKGYGKAFALDWGQANGFIRFLYGHCRERRGSLNGALLIEGKFVGLSGNTGFSTAPHLHFEMRQFITGKKSRYWDSNVDLSYDLLDPVKHFLLPWKIPFTYK